jgi:hypothetical protein
VACPQGLSSTGTLKPCSGHGKCSSLRSAAATSNFIQFYNGSTYTDWDADMIHGCVCDFGWHGVNCSLRTCPYGNNPSSSGQDAVQVIDCLCDDYHCLGSFIITVRSQKTVSLPINSTQEILTIMLQVRAEPSLSSESSLRLSFSSFSSNSPQ